TLAHLSDPHLPPLPAARLRDFAGKRALGYLNWTRNRHKYHRREVLDALVADMHAQRPDHIAVTGDLVNLALEAEFTPAQAWLESVGTPQRVTVVPGNHDAHVRATRHHFTGAIEFADEAPHGLEGAPRRAEAARCGTGPARPRPHPFDDVARRRRSPDPRGWRAVGFGAGAPALSGRGLQSVFDRARQRKMALR